MLHNIFHEQTDLYDSPQNNFELCKFDQVQPKFQGFCFTQDSSFMKPVSCKHASCKHHFEAAHSKQPGPQNYKTHLVRTVHALWDWIGNG